MKKEVMIIPGIAKPDIPFNHVVRADRFLFLTSQLSVDRELPCAKSTGRL